MDDQLRRDGNYTTAEGATLLVKVINRYWHRRGYMPAVFIEDEKLASTGCHPKTAFVVRSDMVGGRPRRLT